MAEAEAEDEVEVPVDDIDELLVIEVNDGTALEEPELVEARVLELTVVDKADDVERLEPELLLRMLELVVGTTELELVPTVLVLGVLVDDAVLVLGTLEETVDNAELELVDCAIEPELEVLLLVPEGDTTELEEVDKVTNNAPQTPFLTAAPTDDLR